MKSIIIFCGLLCLTLGVAAQSKTIIIKVAGNCEMCKSKIEKTALGAGAITAAWDSETQLLAISTDEKANSLDIEKAIAATGYDTEHIQGDATAYSNLPHCCQYDRVAAYDHAEAGCCESHADSAVSCTHDNMKADCCKHKENIASCCAPLANGSKADCCKEGKDCCTAGADHATCCSAEHTCIKSADNTHCCGQESKCTTSGCCKKDMTCCASIKVGDACCTGGKCDHIK